jgi:cytochrome c oxidase cbb3-type subunit 3
MSGFWSWYVVVIVVVNIVGNAWLLMAMRRIPRDAVGEGESLGHEFDGIEELNHPLPRWWLWVFVVSIVWGVIYLALYPGLGRFGGVLDWTSIKQWEEQVAKAEALYGPIFAAYYQRPIPDLLSDQRAVTIGARLFANRCSPCHGSDARGGTGFPNLTDGDWLHGGTPEIITTTILNGRNAMMPAWGAVIGEDGVSGAANYVLSLSGRDHDPELAKQGATIFQTICQACHGLDGKGKQEVGSANLTDNTWLHGGSVEAIRETIRNGRINQMPAHKDPLGEEKVHLLALYVYSLSHSE